MSGLFVHLLAVAAVGAASAAARPGTRRLEPRYESRPDRDSVGRRSVGPAVVFAVATVVFLLGPGHGAVTVVLVTAVRAARSRRSGLRSEALHPAMASHLATLADLVAVGLRSGRSLADVLVRLQGNLDAGIDERIAMTLRRFRQGQPLIDAFDSAFRGLGPDAQRLTDLLASEQAGVAIAVDLTAWSRDLRMAEQQVRATRARRLPVEMLAPLLLCVLPAFLLLTIVPLVLDGLSTIFAPDPLG